MGSVTLITILPPGADVHICGSYLRVKAFGMVTDYDALKLNRQIDAGKLRRMKFLPFLSVPDDAVKPLFLVRADMQFDVDFTPRSLELIKQGARFTTTLEEGIELRDSPHEVELRIDLLYPVREMESGAVLLGIMEAVTETVPDSSVVAMLDILGFSHHLESQSLDEIQQRYLALTSGVMFAGLMSIGGFVFDDKGNLEVAEQSWTVDFGMFADTVVVYPRPLIDQPFRVTCEAVALLIDTALETEWLLRGAIEFGTFRALPEHQAFLGQAITRAHRLETFQSWAGAVIGDTAVKTFSREIRELRQSSLIVEYPIPMKRGAGIEYSNGLAVNWCIFDIGSRDRIAKLAVALNAAPDEAKVKIRETIKFCQEMERRNLASIQKLGGPAIGDPTGGQYHEHLQPPSARRPSRKKGSGRD